MTDNEEQEKNGYGCACPDARRWSFQRSAASAARSLAFYPDVGWKESVENHPAFAHARLVRFHPRRRRGARGRKRRMPRSPVALAIPCPIHIGRASQEREEKANMLALVKGRDKLLYDD